MLRINRALFAIAIYSVALLVPFVLENASEIAARFPESFRARLEWWSGRYHAWLAGPRGLEARYTALVTLNERTFPSVINDACKQRELVTDLLPRLADAGAAIIVLDFSFGQNACPATPQNTQTEKLLRELAATARKVPVVVGQASRSLDQIDSEVGRDLKQHGVVGGGLLLRPIVNLPIVSDGAGLYVGLLRLNQDLSRVPLEWPTYREQNGVPLDAGLQPSLALQAARVFRRPFPNGDAYLKQLTESGSHPFTTLLTKSKLINVNAADLLCNTDFSISGRSVCRGIEKANEATLKVRGKIVVVGWEDDGPDIFPSRVGPMAGMTIHANFIESLLDSRLLKPVGYGWQVLLSIVWFGLIEIPFLVWPHALERALLTALLIMATVAFFLYYVVVVNLGFYLALLPPSVFALLLRFWYQWFERKREKELDSSGAGASVVGTPPDHDSEPMNETVHARPI